MKCGIEIFIDDRWQAAAEFEVRPAAEVAKGYRGAGFLNYNADFVENYLDRLGPAAVSCRYKVNYELHSEGAWPSFLLDLLPAGASRRYWIEKLELKRDDSTADWPLLINAAGNPPGNIRIAEAARRLTQTAHEGFSYEEVLARKETFIEYANTHGAPVAGSTGAQGDAPKFLLTEDKKGRWHADGALHDSLTAKHWLVKFPRSKQESDRAILRNESAYAKVAKEVGLNVHALPHFAENVLFVPRFDREVTSVGVLRNGQESLCSLAGHSEFGQKIPQEQLCAHLAKYSSDPKSDIKEFVIRDVFNVAMGNTDNHARNTAVSKYLDNTTRLSPLFDFAPMFLDDQGIARVCRWTNSETMGYPDWTKVAVIVERFGIDPGEMLQEFRRLSKVVHELPTLMEHCGVDKFLIERLELRTKEVAAALARV